MRLPDERYTPAPIYPAKCILYCHGALAIAVCQHCAAESQTFVQYQGASAKYADLAGQSRNASE